jgi:hypothetical protein
MATSFDRLKKDIEDLLEHNYYDLGDFACRAKEHTLPAGTNLKVELEADLTVEAYDSYGDEDTYLGLVFRFPDYDDILVLFEGKRQSHSGDNWTGFRQVESKTRSVHYYE